MISITQLRTARALLNLSQSEVASQLGIAANTLSKIEGGQSDPGVRRMQEIQGYYEANGVEFTEGDGVRRQQGYIREYAGADGFRHFMDDVYHVVKKHGGFVCVHNVNPDNWIKWMGTEWNEMHTARMQTIEKKFDYRITINQGNDNLIGKHAEYRWLPEDQWNDQSFYAYGDKLALMLFQPDAIKIHVIHNRQFAEGFRQLFSLAWMHIPAIVEVEDAE